MKKLVSSLRSLGLDRRDVVASVGGNSTEVWDLLKATEYLGLSLALLNRSAEPSLNSRIMDKVGAQVAIGYGPVLDRPIMNRLVDYWLVDGKLIEVPPDSERPNRRPAVASGLPGDVTGTVIFSTSGSTGEPKCVTSSLANRDFCARTIGEYLGLEKGQTIINAYPPSFDYGFYQGLLAEKFGLGLDLILSPLLYGDILARVRTIERSVLPMTPTAAARLCRGAGHEEFPLVEAVSLTGGAVPLGLRKRLAEVFPRARIFAMYGLTECKRVSYLPPTEFLTRPKSCGRPMHQVGVRIIGEDGTTVRMGEEGQLVVVGPNVCLGYWGDAAANSATYRPGNNGEIELFTGDYFRQDDDGYLEFLGRKDSQVKLQDERVSLSAAESELKQSELVMEVVLSLDRTEDGETELYAVIVPASKSVTKMEILRSFGRVASKAAHIPTKIVISSGVNTNAHGKVDRSSILRHDEPGTP